MRIIYYMKYFVIHTVIDVITGGFHPGENPKNSTALDETHQGSFSS